jgi:hypothetical protein
MPTNPIDPALVVPSDDGGADTTTGDVDADAVNEPENVGLISLDSYETMLTDFDEAFKYMNTVAELNDTFERDRYNLIMEDCHDEVIHLAISVFKNLRQMTKLENEKIVMKEKLDSLLQSDLTAVGRIHERNYLKTLLEDTEKEWSQCQQDHETYIEEYHETIDPYSVIIDADTKAVLLGLIDVFASTFTPFKDYPQMQSKEAKERVFIKQLLTVLQIEPPRDNRHGNVRASSIGYDFHPAVCSEFFMAMESYQEHESMLIVEFIEQYGLMTTLEIQNLKEHIDANDRG